MIALSLTLIFSAGSRNTLSVFTTQFATVPGFKGLSGIIAGSVYGVLAFIGFDAAAPLAEETRNPTRTVGRAVVGSCLLVGLFYVLTTYAATVYFGPGKFVTFYTAGGGNPWNLMATAVWGVGWVFLFIALLNSSAACSNGGGCAAARCLWAMGRIRVIPHAFGRTQPRFEVAVRGRHHHLRRRPDPDPLAGRAVHADDRVRAARHHHHRRDPADLHRGEHVLHRRSSGGSGGTSST